MIKLRLAQEQDAKAILDIYRPYVTDTVITFETEVPSLAEFTARIQGICKEYPYLVAEQEGCIVGYAYAHRFRERAAYQWDAELSIYVAQGQHKNGIGSRLYAALLELCACLNIYNVYGIVTVPNTASERLHSMFGFARVGDYHNTGFKHGKWHDIANFEKALQTSFGTPQPLRLISDLKEEEIQTVLKKYSE